MNQSTSQKALSRALNAFGSIAIASIGVFGALTILVVNSITLMFSAVSLLINSVLAVLLAQSFFMQVMKVIMVLMLLQALMPLISVSTVLSH